jgi:carbon-monoxide dehydrogenase medium subunit
VQKAAPALAEAAMLIGDPAVRSRGTIGGNIAHADPASDLPTVLVALDARIIAVGASGERTIDADGFFTGIMSTALAENEVITAIVLPAAARGQGSAYVKFPHPASRYAVIGVAAALTMTNGECAAARLALGGLLPHATRATAVEQALTGKSLDTATIARAAAKVSSDLGGEVTGDIFASAEYRAAVAPVYVKRVVAAAAARAGLA